MDQYTQNEDQTNVINRKGFYLTIQIRSMYPHSKKKLVNYQNKYHALFWHTICPLSKKILHVQVGQV